MQKLVTSIVNEILGREDESPSCSCGCGVCETNSHPLLEKTNEPTFLQLIRAAERDGHISGMETSANYITSTAKKIAKEFDNLHPEEKKVLGKSYYNSFLKKIGKIPHPLLEETQSDLPDEYLSKYDILFTKTREKINPDGKPIAHYELTWKGHDIEWGGLNFSSKDELERYANNYDLPINLYKKLRYKDPIK